MESPSLYHDNDKIIDDDDDDDHNSHLKKENSRLHRPGLWIKHDYKTFKESTVAILEIINDHPNIENALRQREVLANSDDTILFRAMMFTVTEAAFLLASPLRLRRGFKPDITRVIEIGRLRRGLAA